MNTTTSLRYSSPATRPPLAIPTPSPRPSGVRPPVLCLHCATDAGHTAPRLVSFDWGRVATPLWRR